MVCQVPFDTEAIASLSSSWHEIFNVSALNALENDEERGPVTSILHHFTTKCFTKRLQPKRGLTSNKRPSTQGKQTSKGMRSEKKVYLEERKDLRLLWRPFGYWWNIPKIITKRLTPFKKKKQIWIYLSLIKTNYLILLNQIAWINVYVFNCIFSTWNRPKKNTSAPGVVR